MKTNEKQKKTRDYYIPVEDKLIPVSKEVYEEYYRPIWRTHYHASKHGQCGCSDWRRCEGDCGLCHYRAAGDTLSLDKEQEDVGDIHPDPATYIEDMLMDKLLLEELFQALEELDPDSRRICELIKQGKTEREIAAEFNVRQSTLNYRKRKLMDKLRERLNDFI